MYKGGRGVGGAGWAIPARGRDVLRALGCIEHEGQNARCGREGCSA